jgi:hypothetical protein
MSKKEVYNVSEKLKKDNKIYFSNQYNLTDYTYLSGKGSNPIVFNFNDKNLLNSVTLKDVYEDSYIFEQYVKKYKELSLESEKKSLISYIGPNKDYDPSSEYIREGVTTYCKGEDRDNWFYEFKAKVTASSFNHVIVKRVKDNPTIIRKGEALIQIKEEEKSLSDPVKEYSIHNSLLNIDSNNLSFNDRMNDGISGIESSHNFYKRTRSRYYAVIEHKNYRYYTYEITYQRALSYDNEIKRIKDLKIERDKESIEYKNKKEQRQKSSYDEI